ncbi:MAG TPA: hypothetical protein PK471_00595 [Bacteroidales bacterium]|nr:hypothetical protein [Bacteroidales bacterium]HQQ20387.1 hypothetical protein [Bacteroidales bacterium]
MKKEERLLFWGVISLLGMIALYPLNRVGIATGDDFGYMIWSLDHFLEGSIAYAKSTGRFYFILVQWIYKIPYLFDNQLYFHTMLILPILASFILFVTLIHRIFKNQFVTLLTALLITLFYQISGGHSATAAYPFYFSFSFSLIIGSLHLLYSYIQGGRYYLLLISALLFGIATIFYESYLVYYLLIFIFIIHRYSWSSLKEKKKRVLLYKELIPFVFFGILYLTTYYLFFKSTPSQYGGNTLASQFNFSLFLKALATMTLYTFPFSTLFDYHFFITESSTQYNQSFHLYQVLFTEASMVAYVKAIIATALFLILTRKNPVNMDKKRLLVVALIALFFIIAPHLPLALSEKYSNHIQTTYVTTFFAFFAMILFLFAMIAFLLQWGAVKKWRNRLVLGFLTLFIFISTLSIQFVNERITDDLAIGEQRLTHLKIVFNPEFIQYGSPVYTEQLHHTGSYFTSTITRQLELFHSFAKEKCGLKIKAYPHYDEFYNQFKDQERLVYLMYHTQSSKTGDSQILIVPLLGTQLQEQFENNRCDSLIASYLSAHKKFSIQAATDSICELLIDENPITHYSNFHHANLLFLNKPSSGIIKIGGCQIIPQSISISNQIIHGVPLLKLGQIPSHYENAWVRQIMRELQRDQSSVKMIKQKADEQRIPYRKALRADARWILYYELQ